MSSTYTLSPIASISTPFKQKFAIPRQPGLAKAQGKITFEDGYDGKSMLKGIEDYSHLWLLFLFHENIEKGWKNTVKAPRFGGNKTVGVLATRSTHRPNSIGMSVVSNKGIHSDGGSLYLEVEGVDLVDGTPIIDIKPYLAYADSLTSATDKLDNYQPIPNRCVSFDSGIANVVQSVEQQHKGFKDMVINVLAQDPRPAYKQHIDDDPKTYKVALYDIDIGFVVRNGEVNVTEINPR